MSWQNIILSIINDDNKIIGLIFVLFLLDFVSVDWIDV